MYEIFIYNYLKYYFKYFLRVHAKIVQTGISESIRVHAYIYVYIYRFVYIVYTRCLFNFFYVYALLRDSLINFESIFS